jgi:hypothetical protein
LRRLLVSSKKASHMSERSQSASGGLSTRSVELFVAAVLFLIGSLVVYDSVRLGASWGSDGPEAGYFPFYIGSLISLSSAVICVQALFGRAARKPTIFVEWQSLRQVLSVLLPALLFVLAIQLIGLYSAAVLYIAGFMIWLGGYGWLKSVLLAFAVSALAFVTFEIWFQVPLYKGAVNPLALIGY